MTTVMIGKTASEHSSSRLVGKTSSSYVLGGAWRNVTCDNMFSDRLEGSEWSIMEVAFSISGWG